CIRGDNDLKILGVRLVEVDATREGRGDVVACRQIRRSTVGVHRAVDLDGDLLVGRRVGTGKRKADDVELEDLYLRIPHRDLLRRFRVAEGHRVGDVWR